MSRFPCPTGPETPRCTRHRPPTTAVELAPAALGLAVVLIVVRPSCCCAGPRTTPMRLEHGGAHPRNRRHRARAGRRHAQHGVRRAVVAAGVDNELLRSRVGQSRAPDPHLGRLQELTATTPRSRCASARCRPTRCARARRPDHRGRRRRRDRGRHRRHGGALPDPTWWTRSCPRRSGCCRASGARAQRGAHGGHLGGDGGPAAAARRPAAVRRAPGLAPAARAENDAHAPARGRGGAGHGARADRAARRRAAGGDAQRGVRRAVWGGDDPRGTR